MVVKVSVKSMVKLLTTLAKPLLELGVSLPLELQYLDDMAHLKSIVALLTPVTAKMFARMMKYVTRGF
jgi:hypothetical protein